MIIKTVIIVVTIIIIIIRTVKTTLIITTKTITLLKLKITKTMKRTVPITTIIFISQNNTFNMLNTTPLQNNLKYQSL